MFNKATVQTGLGRSLVRQCHSKFVFVLAVAAFAGWSPSLRADSGEDQPEQSALAGTWISVEAGEANIVSFMRDGRMLFSGAINILTGNGPGGSSELAAPAPGEWVRTTNRDFATTAFSILSSPLVGFTHLVKLTGTYTLNKTSDELTLSNPMVAVYLPDGTLQFPPFPGNVRHFKRVIAGL